MFFPSALAKTKFRWIGLVLLMLVTNGAGVLPSYAVTLYSEDLPPFNYVEDGTVTGIGVEVVRLALQQDDSLKADIIMRPWKRAFRSGQTEPDAGVFSMARSAKREPDFQWVGPLFSIRSYLWAKGDRNLTLSSLEEAKPLSVTVQSGGSGEQELIDEGFERIIAVQDTDRMYDLLMVGRVDLMRVPDLMIKRYLDVNRYPDDAIRAVWSKGQRDLYIGFSLNTDPAIVARWRQALEKAKATEAYEAILRAYGTVQLP